MTLVALNSNIKYYQALQKKYAELYREALKQETLLVGQRIKLSK
jgi:hypothetical protein